MEHDEGSGPGYSPSDRTRWVPEPPKRTGRSAFQRDRARVLHGAALRRMAAKTQVVAPTTDDFSRNRLTHSLEVGQVGRELGRQLGCDPDLVETACLAHDLGHPPFGHNGEDALDAAAADCGGFEGNAQTLRVLTRLEGKSFTASGRSAGLNLTRAALDATIKYPWPRRGDTGKFGVYPDDLEVFGWIRPRELGERRCLEAQVMDFADDVAYSVHDVEDGVWARTIDLKALTCAADVAEIAAIARETYLPDAGEAELAERAAVLAALDWWPYGHDPGRRGMAALKNMTSQLIGRFCTAAEHATRAAYGPGTLTRYAADLVVPRETQAEVALLKATAARYVMRTDARAVIQEREREILAELVELFTSTAPGSLEVPFREDWDEAADDTARRRVVLDQIASLSDTSAVGRHATLRAAARR